MTSELATRLRCRAPSASSRRPARWCSRIAAAARWRPRTRIAAFDNGLALGADGLELDVHLSRDGVVVVHHDRTLDRTTTSARPDRAIARADELATRRRARRSPRSCARYPRRARHRRDEGRTRRSSRRGGRRRRPRAGRRRPRLPRLVRPARAARRASARAGDRDQRARAKKCAGRCIGRGAAGRCRASPYARLSGAGAGRPHARRLAARSSTTRTAPASASRCGRWTREDDARRLLGWGVDALITDRPDVIVPLVAMRQS